MNLAKLKAMIKEEYSNFANYKVSEQDEPMVNVGPGDIEVGGDDEDSEDTLRQIYDMLKAHFEGDDKDADMDDMDDMDDKGDDKPAAPKAPKAAKPPAAKPPAPKAPAKDADDKDADDDKALQERFQKLANIIKG